MSAAHAPIFIAERCHYCSRERHPGEVLRIIDIRICRYCFADSQKKILALQAIGAPEECPECHTSFADLGRGNCEDVKMVLVPKDGIYQLLCQPCAGQYVPKRVDLYGPTAFGRRMKLK